MRAESLAQALDEEELEDENEMAIFFQREAHALNIATHVAVQLVAQFLAATSNSDNGSDALHLRSGHQFTIWARSPL